MDLFETVPEPGLDFLLERPKLFAHTLRYASPDPRVALLVYVLGKPRKRFLVLAKIP